eukprot:Hpha_TRINITY_DN10647_c0_g4::TRINITY_DN10647_c0_g4_i1::g.156948::m.156948/K03259/EIF4E; translation initiation factor 4E
MAKYVPRGKYSATLAGEGPPPQPPARGPPARDAAPAADQGRQGLWTGGGSLRGSVFPPAGGNTRNSGEGRESERPARTEEPREAFWQGRERPTTTTTTTRETAANPPAPAGHDRFSGLQHGGVQKYAPPARREEAPKAPAPRESGPKNGAQRQRPPAVADGGSRFAGAFSSLQTRGREKDDDAAPTVHPLADEWTFYWRQRPEPQDDAEAFAQKLQRIADCGTVEGFWALLCHVVPPDQLPPNTEYLMFRHGVRPIWEDPENARGGKFLIRLQKGAAAESWEELVLHLVGAQFDPYDEVVGLTISVRPKDDVLSVWTRSAHDARAIAALEGQIKGMLEQRRVTNFEYRPHGASRGDQQQTTSSFNSSNGWIAHA